MTIRRFGCAALVAILSLIGDAHAAPTLGGCPVFPANNYWNTPVDGLAVHASSAAWVNSIGATTRLHPDWGNVLADNYGIPFVTVTGSQAKVPITFDPDGYPDESDPGPFPIPPNAPIEGGNASDGDRHVIVVDTTNCMLYELFNAFPVGGGASWTVSSSAKFDLRSNALRPDMWTSADAAGFAVFPGLVRWDEVAAGEIAHAIRFTASRIWGRNAGAPYYLWPARHWSGSSTDSTRPPMGARFRLKSSFDISGFDARTQVILRAMKKYGLVLADAGSNWYFQGVSDTQWPGVVFDQLKSIAGDNFEAVDTSVMQLDANTAEAKQAGGTSYQGLWLKRPLDESGWGVNLTHQGDILFATWFTYDNDGSGMWLVMSNGAQTSAGNFSGTLYRTTGPPFDATPFTPIVFPNNYTTVGTLSFSFTDADTGTMTYTVNGVTQSKPIGRYLYASGGTNCQLGGSQGASPNYQDLWLAAPVNSEAGWGVNLTHQGDILFATWFTYEAGGRGMWLVMSRGDKTAPGVYTGELQRTTGPAFSAVPFNPSLVTRTTVGSATFRFTDANNGTFSYTVNGISQSKPITRLFYATPVTVCS